MAAVRRYALLLSAVALLSGTADRLAAQSDSAAASRTLARALDTASQGMRTVFSGDDDGGLRPRLVDPSETAWRDDAARWERIASTLRRLSDTELSVTERITRRALLWEADMQARKADFWWYDFSMITPYASPMRNVTQRIARRRLATSADTGAYLALLREAASLFDGIRTGLERRAARGIRLAQPALPASVALLRTYTVRGGDNPFAVRAQQTRMLDSATAAAFGQQASAIVDAAIVPAAERLVSLLTGPYADAAPRTVGLSTYRGGRAYYDWLVQWNTTLPITAKELHDYGTSEVARIEREMAQVRAELGFTGTREAFHARLARDPRFFAKTPEEFGARLMMYAERLRPLLPQAFAKAPRAPGDVRRLAPELEPAMTFGFYQPPGATDSIGHYFFNGTGLDQRSLLTAAPLIAHELWPGHHYQVALAQENTAIPAARRARFYTAFSEGWGDYASLVAGDLGLYRDPYDRYGRLAMEMFIACRLVVDTGVHAFGWSLERVRAYMRAHVLESETQILTESLRYSTDLPGQALAYKAGSREFLQLRESARSRLGSAFDLRAFHVLMLDQGSLPLAVVRERVAAWDGRMP